VRAPPAKGVSTTPQLQVTRRGRIFKSHTSPAKRVDLYTGIKCRLVHTPSITKLWVRTFITPNPPSLLTLLCLASATSVDSEPLEHEFNGILGLALPLNSVIAQQITPVTGNGRDGAPFASNLFGISPASSAPSSRFLSLSLARPGSSAIPSLLGIGRHPSDLVHDPSKIKYSSVVQENKGTLFWQVQVRAITVYVNGSSFSVKLDNPRPGNVLPVAVLDSGVPYILAESSIANGIYGALGVGPASDGQCKDIHHRI